MEQRKRNCGGGVAVACLKVMWRRHDGGGGRGWPVCPKKAKQEEPKGVRFGIISAQIIPQRRAA